MVEREIKIKPKKIKSKVKKEGGVLLCCGVLVLLFFFFSLLFSSLGPVWGVLVSPRFSGCVT